MKSVVLRKTGHREKPQRGHAVVLSRMALVAIVLLTASFGYAVGEWDGASTTSSLSYRDSIQLMADEAAPSQRRINAAGNVFALTEQAGEVFGHMESARLAESDQEVLEIWRARVLEAWSR